MTDKKIRVYNKTNHDVGVGSIDGIKSWNVKPNSFIKVDVDEVINWHFTSTLFAKKHLVIDDIDVLNEMGLSVEDMHIPTNDEIENTIHSTPKDIEQTFGTDIQGHIKERIIEVAKKSETLPMNNVKTIEKITGVDLYEKDGIDVVEAKPIDTIAPKTQKPVKETKNISKTEK